MKNTDWSVTAVALPIESRMFCMFETLDFADAYAIRLPKNAIADPELLSRFLFSHHPQWVALLMQVRDALVGRFGIKTYSILSTVVHCQNHMGRAYIALITPFHQWIVRSILGSAARIGWPTS
jgi:hypothetical protein